MSRQYFLLRVRVCVSESESVVFVCTDPSCAVGNRGERSVFSGFQKKSYNIKKLINEKVFFMKQTLAFFVILSIRAPFLHLHTQLQ